MANDDNVKGDSQIPDQPDAEIQAVVQETFGEGDIPQVADEDLRSTSQFDDGNRDSTDL